MLEESFEKGIGKEKRTEKRLTMSSLPETKWPQLGTTSGEQGLSLADLVDLSGTASKSSRTALPCAHQIIVVR